MEALLKQLPIGARKDGDSAAGSSVGWGCSAIRRANWENRPPGPGDRPWLVQPGTACVHHVLRTGHSAPLVVCRPTAWRGQKEPVRVLKVFVQSVSPFILHGTDNRPLQLTKWSVGG